MKQMFMRAMLGGAAMLIAGSASATTININFDSVATGSTNPVFGGIAFQNTLVESSGFEASSPNSIVSLSSPFEWTQADAVGVTFTTPATSASIVGLNVGFNGLRLDAFDAGNNLVDSMTVFGTTEGGTAPPNPPGETFTLTVSGSDITRLAIYQTTNQFNDTIVLDNFSATIGDSAVPEPASLTLVALGLAGAAARRRRRS